eukprot:gene5744-7933_t
MSFSNETLSNLWSLRVKIAYHLLQNGTDVFMVDNDAIWLRNPFSLFNSLPSAAIFSSRGSYPSHISNRLGATLCVGFIYIKSNYQTIQLFESVHHVMLHAPGADDQVFINDILVNKHNLQFSNKMLSYVNSTEINFGEFSSNNQTAQLALLPHSAVVRLCGNVSWEEVESSIVAHCLSEKKLLSKVLEQMKHRLWVLRDDWKITDENHNLTLFFGHYY